MTLKASATYSVLSQIGMPGDLIIGQDGNLYGTAVVGNSAALFELTPDGAYTNLNTTSHISHITQAPDGTFYGVAYDTAEYIFKLLPDDSLQPLAGFDDRGRGEFVHELTVGDHGFVYGITGYYEDPGTIFRVQPQDGNYKKLANKDYIAEVRSPQDSLLYGRDRNFYGVAADVHRIKDDPGSIFKVTAEGVVTTLYTFSSRSQRRRRTSRTFDAEY